VVFPFGLNHFTAVRIPVDLHGRSTTLAGHSTNALATIKRGFEIKDSDDSIRSFGMINASGPRSIIFGEA